jgi:hypothetical protein
VARNFNSLPTVQHSQAGIGKNCHLGNVASGPNFSNYNIKNVTFFTETENLCISNACIMVVQKFKNVRKYLKNAKKMFQCKVTNVLVS